MEGGSSVKRKRSLSENDDDDRRASSSSISDTTTSSGAGCVELQIRVYDMTVLKLKTAAPLTRSQRRREPPLLRTVLMFNTLRRIEKSSMEACGAWSSSAVGRVDGGGAPAAASPSSSVDCGLHSSTTSALRTHVVAASKDVEMDLLPTLPSEYLFSCSVDRPDAECFCQSYDAAAYLLRPATPMESSSSGGGGSVPGELTATPTSSSSRCSNFFSPPIVIDDAPIITFSSLLEFDPPSPLDSAAAAKTVAAAAAAAPASESSSSVVCDLNFDWSDFDFTAPAMPDAAEPMSSSSSQPSLMDFDVDFDTFGNFELPTTPPPAQQPQVACSHATTCNHRNELLADELERIVQQILVGTS